MNKITENEIIQAAKIMTEKPLDLQQIETSTKKILEAIGEDPEREGLIRTPLRVARSYEELLGGYRTDPITIINQALFDTNSADPVLVKNIEFYSMCEHHMLPIIGRAHIEYFPNGKIIGLSKIPRVVDLFARRLQIQENMTQEIADFLNIVIKPHGIAVMIEGTHFCSMIRGVKKQDASMTTIRFQGIYEQETYLRNEFLNKISQPDLSILVD